MKLPTLSGPQFAVMRCVGSSGDDCDSMCEYSAEQINQATLELIGMECLDLQETTRGEQVREAEEQREREREEAEDSPQRH